MRTNNILKRTIALIGLGLAACLPSLAQDQSENHLSVKTMLDAEGTNGVNTVQYYDGLGRPHQRMKTEFTGMLGHNPLHDELQYDLSGRPCIDLLPVPGSNRPGNLLASQREAMDFYGDNRPYTETVYQPSPLDRVAEVRGAGEAWEGHARTYRYLQNDTSDTLRCVLPPMCEGECGDDVLEKYAFQYEYDNRGHVVEKKLPGASPVKYTYDEAGHLTYEQSGNQVLEHTVYLYDRHGRLAVQGKYRPKFSLGDGPKSVLPELKGETWYCIPLWHSGTSMALGTRYADIGYLLTYYVPLSINPGIGLAARDGVIGGGDWEIKPIQPDKKFDPEFRLVNYYDDYGFLDLEGFKGKPYFTAPAGNGRGQLTGNMTATTDGKTKLYSVYHYDKYGREVKRVEENALGGYDVTETSYTFTGKPLVVTHTHNAPGKSSLTEKYTYSYDTGDRVKEIKHSLDGKADVVLATYEYDEFGRLKNKKLHGGSAQQVGYSYNLRGWLTGIDGGKFTQSLYYNTGNGTPAYNGNISSMTWRAGDESAIRGYKFTYDALSRLKNAAYGEGTGLSSNTGRFSENVTNYDLNGNITGLQRYGQTGSSYGLVDNLTFTLNGNQLNRVDDSANGGLFEDAVKQANEYAYDRNANMTKDLNRNISSIAYNSLNLPDKVTFGDGNTIASTYLVDGTKLNTVRTIGGATTTTDYCGNAVYENGTLKFLLTDEGYITPDDGKYHYYLTDHLGNNRVIVGQTGNVEEVNHYYPFGGMFASTNVQPYKYNGKEWDEKAKWYDYGARNYDPALMRFNTLDPLAENYYSISPYAYCGNNPINWIDPTGMVWEDPDDADRLKKKIDKKIESLNEDIEKWQSKIDNGNLKDKKLAKLNRKLDEAKERISNLQQSKKDIDLLGEDMEHIYAFNQIDGGKHQVWQGEDEIVYIDTSSDALSIHEITHIRQSLAETKRLKFRNGYLENARGTNYKTFASSEVEAYQRQYSYDRSFPGNTFGKGLQGIDIHSVGNIVDPQTGKHVYPLIWKYLKSLEQ